MDECARSWYTTVVRWLKSSYSSFSSNCVEVARLGRDLIGVRDSKERGKVPGPILLFSVSEWAQFLGQIKNGDFAFC